MKVLRYFGLGEESVFGTPVPALVHFDPAATNLDSPTDQLIKYTGGLGRRMRKVKGGPYISGGSIEFAGDISTLDLILYFLLGTRTTDATGQASVVAEPFSTGVGETILNITLANTKVVPNTVIIDVAAALVAHDDGFGKIVEDASSGITGTIDYASGKVTLAGLIASTQYDFDYDHGFFVHTLSDLEDTELPSPTIRLGKDEFEHTFSGTMLSQLTLSVDREFLNLSMDIVAGKDIKDTIQAKSALKLVVEEPIPFHKMDLSIGPQGGAVASVGAKVNSLELVINNNGSTEVGMGLNSRFPNAAFAGELEITGSAELRFEDTSHKEDFWGGAAAPSEDGPNPKEIQIDMEANNNGSAIFTLPRALYDSAPVVSSGRDKIVQPIAFTNFEDGTTEKIIEVIINNLYDLI